MNVFAQENEWTAARPDGHAPISVMGDHYHKKGELMFSYRYMPMWMEGTISGTNSVSNDAVFNMYMASPQTMKMDMHMLGAMYAVSDRITLAAMANYLSNSMDLKTRMGMGFETSSSGLGDVAIAGLVKIMNKNRQSLHGNIGFSIPTGNIDQRGNTPMMENAQLAYPMQLGSGTFDPFIGATYLGQSDKVSWGAQSTYQFRLGENSEGYTLGNKLNAVAWGAYKVADFMSLSVSATYFDIQGISGQDPDMNPMMMPLFNTANSGRKQLDVGLGTNFYVSSGTFKNLRIGAEVKLPTYQSVTGTQMENKLMAVVGLQYSLGGSHH